MSEKELKSFIEKITGCCPLCQSKTSEEVESYVRKEIAKVARDPNYKPKTYSKREKVDEQTGKISETE